MTRRNSLDWLTSLALTLPMTLGAGCASDELDDLDDLGPSLEAEDEAVGIANGMDELGTASRGTPAVPGFAVATSVVGDDVVLDWSATGITGTVGSSAMIVLRSEDPSVLIDFTPSDLDSVCDGPGPQGYELFEPGITATSFIDIGAASQSSATPTYFYRVVRIFEDPGANVCDTGIDEESTLLAKVTTPMAAGYVKFGLCMLDGPQVASEIAAQVGQGTISVHAWDEQNQSWMWWSNASGEGPFGDFELPYGGMVAVNFDGWGADFVSLVGTVPTDEGGLEPVQGLNHLTTPLLTASMLADTASGYVDGLGWYDSVGIWDAPTQTTSWYSGPGDMDFAIEGCHPYKFQGAPVSCSADAECNPGQYCAFDVTDSCGSTGAGACTPIPLGCGADDEPVCGCDGVTYANSCEAQLAGASVESVGACEPPPSACPCAGSPIWDAVVAAGADGMADHAQCDVAIGDLYVGEIFDEDEETAGGFGMLFNNNGPGTAACVAIDFVTNVDLFIELDSEEQIDACIDEVDGWVANMGLTCG